jgi:UrcA family protein
MFFPRTLAFLSLAGSVIAAPAVAQSVDERVSINVSYADLDIRHASGAAVLLHRLDAAAVRACGGEPDLRVLAAVAAFEKCRTTALNQAVAQVNAPALTAAAAHSDRPVLFVRR